MFTLKTLHATAIEKWLANVLDKIIRKLQIAPCLVILRAVIFVMAINELRKSEIDLLNLDPFQKHAFIDEKLEEVGFV